MANFRTTFKAIDKTLIQWFPGHMNKGIRQMQQRLKQVDCVIEVHDARIPFSGRNIELRSTVTGLKPHILVMNKKDLGEEKYYDRISAKIKSEEGIDNVIFTNCKDQQCPGTKKILPIVKHLIGNSDRYNRTNLSEYCLMVVGVPNVGKSSIINVLRNRHMKLKGATQVGAVAGITRSVLTRIKIAQNPNIFLFDTPGILTPQILNHHHGLKLAAVSCLQDHLVGPLLIADYILYWLNRNGNYEYVHYMAMDEPSDSIEEVTLAGSKMLNKTIKRKHYDGSIVMRPDFDLAAAHFIKGFRAGLFGKVNMDNDLFAESDELNT